MEVSGKQKREKKKVTQVTTFPIPFALGEIKKHITTNTPSKPSKEQLINQAFKFHSLGNILEAEKYYHYFINQGFKDHRVFSNYGTILKDLGKLEEAEIATRKAIELNPNFADAYNNLGTILIDLGNLQEAEIATRKAIKLNPNFADAYNNLGAILIDLGNLQEAEIATRKAIELNPNFAMAHNNLGTILREIGNLEEAEIVTYKAIELNPDFEIAYSNIFRHYEELNNLKKLDEKIKEFQDIKMLKNELLLFQARLNFRYKKYKSAKELIDNIAPEWIEKKLHNNLLYWSYKAFIEDKVGNYDLAYISFEKSQKHPDYKRFPPDIFLNYIELYKKNILNKKTVLKSYSDEYDDSSLVFLIGFPRSGTTLLDTILRSHKDIDVIEEKPMISTIEKIIKEKFSTKLDHLYDISENNLIFLRKKYFQQLSQYSNLDVKIIIDKLPFNTVPLPLINLLFPNSKIIFTHRNPYDTVLSCFQQFFKPNAAMANLVSLKSSAKMYDQVMEAWDIYKNNLPLNFITSKYEDLIEDFENHTLKIIKFLGIDWDENIKNFRKTAINRGKIYTPSSSQVVESLYKSSIGKWKNYETYFKDSHQYLDKWVSYFDY